MSVKTLFSFFVDFFEQKTDLPTKHTKYTKEVTRESPSLRTLRRAGAD